MPTPLKVCYWVPRYAEVSLTRSCADRNENDKFQFSPATTTSHTVFGISGKDSWNKRPNIPWNTSGSTTSPTLSSPREYSAPSSRQSNGDFPTLKSNGPGDMRSSSTSFRPDFTTSLPMTSKATPLQFNHAPVFGTGLRNLNSDPFGVHADSRAEAIEDTNSNSFYTNKAIDPTSSIRHGGNMTGSDFSGQRESSNGFSDAGDTSAYFPDLRASIFSPAHARFNKDISRTTESSFSSSRFAKRPNIQVTSGQIGPDEEVMASAFGRLGIHSDRLQANGNNDTSSRPFEQQSAPQKRVPGNPSLSRTRYRNFPEEMPMANSSLHDMDDVSGMKMLFPHEYSRSASFGDQGSISPTSSEYRRNLNSPYYSNGGTPLTGPDSGRSASGSGLSSRASNGQISSLDQQMRMSQLYQSEPPFMTFNPLQARMQYTQPYEFSSYPSALRLNPLANPYTMPAYHGPPALSFSSRYPSREHDPSQIMRSPLLEDFRANHKTNKRYELKVGLLAFVLSFIGADANLSF
jgi:mRNA-binding protein PUF3